MSSNDYFHGGYPRHQTNADSPSPAPYPNPQYEPSPQSTPAPSYRSNLPPTGQTGQPYAEQPYAPSDSHLYAPGTGGQPAGPASYKQSPFDTVFDDNVYPASSRQYASNGDVSQQGLYPDTGYYGQGRASPEPRQYSSEDIPLQDRAGKDGASGMNDHIYDDPNGRPSRRHKKKKKTLMGQLGMYGTDKKRIPWVVYLFSVVQVGVIIGEVVKNAQLTGSPIAIHPQFNPMIGPSQSVMINMGARYAPCMHYVEDVQGAEAPGVRFMCPNATKITQTCPLSELCGFGGDVPNPIFDGEFSKEEKPNQWWRFIVPIFMHAGLVHIAFNLLMQLTIGKEMEMGIGSIRFFLVYMSSGIFGFVLGGNFAAPAIASTGASGSLFGIIALTLLDLLYSWQDRKSPVKELMFVILDMVIAFVLGLLPGLDNFSHIGGFLMGLALGICVLHSPNALRRRLGEDPSYATVAQGDASPSFLRNPVGFFKGRKSMWWAWWIVRAAVLIAIVVVFIVLLNNFYSSNPSTCSWCKYLSCLPVHGWCKAGTIPAPS